MSSKLNLVRSLNAYTNQLDYISAEYYLKASNKSDLINLINISRTTFLKSYDFFQQNYDKYKNTFDIILKSNIFNQLNVILKKSKIEENVTFRKKIDTICATYFINRKPNLSLKQLIYIADEVYNNLANKLEKQPDSFTQSFDETLTTKILDNFENANNFAFDLIQYENKVNEQAPVFMKLKKFN